MTKIERQNKKIETLILEILNGTNEVLDTQRRYEIVESKMFDSIFLGKKWISKLAKHLDVRELPKTSNIKTFSDKSLNLKSVKSDIKNLTEKCEELKNLLLNKVSPFDFFTTGKWVENAIVRFEEAIFFYEANI